MRITLEADEEDEKSKAQYLNRQKSRMTGGRWWASLPIVLQFGQSA